MFLSLETSPFYGLICYFLVKLVINFSVSPSSHFFNFFGRIPGSCLLDFYDDGVKLETQVLALVSSSLTFFFLTLIHLFIGLLMPSSKGSALN